MDPSRARSNHSLDIQISINADRRSPAQDTQIDPRPQIDIQERYKHASHDNSSHISAVGRTSVNSKRGRGSKDVWGFRGGWRLRCGSRQESRSARSKRTFQLSVGSR